MSALPGYLKIERVGRASITFRARRWHPSLWLEVARGLAKLARDNGVSPWHPRLWWSFLRCAVGMIRGAK